MYKVASIWNTVSRSLMVNRIKEMDFEHDFELLRQQYAYPPKMIDKQGWGDGSDWNDEIILVYSTYIYIYILAGV